MSYLWFCKMLTGKIRHARDVVERDRVRSTDGVDLFAEDAHLVRILEEEVRRERKESYSRPRSISI